MIHSQGKHAFTSGAIARARAQVTVAADRLSCNPEEMRQMQREVADVLAKYLELDGDICKIRLDIVCRTDRGVQDVKTIQIK